MRWLVAGVAFVVGATFGACSSSSSPTPAPMQQPAPCTASKRALLFDKTQVYHHDSIEPGAAAIQRLGCANDVAVDVTNDAEVFVDDKLAPYAALIFLSTTVENDEHYPFQPLSEPPSDAWKTAIMTDEQKAAFERYVRAGHGYVGIHAASDGDYYWPFYRDMLGAMFVDHATPGEFQQATLAIEDATHPSTSKLPSPWSRTEEWYDFDRNPRDVARVLLTLDESTYTRGPKQCTQDHPMAWCRDYLGTRVFYTALGHNASAFDEPAFQAHLVGAMRWATRLEEGDCTPRVRPTPLPAGDATCNGAPCFSGCRCNTNGTCAPITGHELGTPPNCGAIRCEQGCHCADATKNACACP